MCLVSGAGWTGTLHNRLLMPWRRQSIEKPELAALTPRRNRRRFLGESSVLSAYDLQHPIANSRKGATNDVLNGFLRVFALQPGMPTARQTNPPNL